MKILYIEPTDGCMGAQISLGLLIKGMKEYTENVIHVAHDKRAYEKCTVHNKYTCRCDKRFFWILPELWIKPDSHRIDLQFLKFSIKYILFIFFYILNYSAILRREKYDYIHLNTTALWPIVTFFSRHSKVIIHERSDIHSGIKIIDKMLLRSIRKANRVIAIGELEKKWYTDHSIENVSVLSNPIEVNILKLSEKQREEVLIEYHVPNNRKIISMIGSLDPLKGTNLLLDFLEIKNCELEENSCFFILAGRPNSTAILDSVTDRINIINKQYRNSIVTYIGEISDTSLLYSITDVLIRCEPITSPYGRTFYEGLYAGLNIVFPLNYEIPEDVKKFEDQMYPYINDVKRFDNLNDSLIRAVSCNKSKTNNSCNGNLERYISHITNIYENSM